MAHLLLLLFAVTQTFSKESNDIGKFEDPGKCVCDLTEGGCDAFCCCDKDCDSSVIDVWEDDDPLKDLCVSERFTDFGNLFCARDEEFFRENARRGMKVSSVSVKNLICIEIDNSASVGYFHELITDVSDETVNSRIKDNVEYSDVLGFSSVNPGTTYKAGDVMGSTVNGLKQLGGIWPLPGPNVYGKCNDMSPVR